MSKIKSQPLWFILLFLLCQFQFSQTTDRPQTFQIQQNSAHKHQQQAQLNFSLLVPEFEERRDRFRNSSLSDKIRNCKTQIHRFCNLKFEIAKPRFKMQKSSFISFCKIRWIPKPRFVELQNLNSLNSSFFIHCLFSGFFWIYIDEGCWCFC